MEEQQSGLFEIKINATGTGYIKKLFRLTLFIYILVTLSCLFSLLTEAHLLMLSGRLGAIPARSFWQLRILPFLYVIGTVINAVGVFFYARFYREMFRSISNHDETRFNASFRFAYRNAVLFIVVMVITFMGELTHLKTMFFDLL